MRIERVFQCGIALAGVLALLWLATVLPRPGQAVRFENPRDRHGDPLLLELPAARSKSLKLRAAAER